MYKNTPSLAFGDESAILITRESDGNMNFRFFCVVFVFTVVEQFFGTRNDARSSLVVPRESFGSTRNQTLFVCFVYYIFFLLFFNLSVFF
jgi:hypothetical protein